MQTLNYYCPCFKREGAEGVHSPPPPSALNVKARHRMPHTKHEDRERCNHTPLRVSGSEFVQSGLAQRQTQLRRSAFLAVQQTNCTVVQHGCTPGTDVLIRGLWRTDMTSRKAFFTNSARSFHVATNVAG